MLDTNLALEPALALGIQPVGYASFYGRESILFRGSELTAIQAATRVGSYERPSLEKVLLLQPDLIIARHDQPYDLLSSIAPTIAMPPGTKIVPDEGHLFKEYLFFLAKAFGKESKAINVISDYNHRIERLKRRLNSKVPAVQISVLYFNNNLIYTPARSYDSVSDVLSDLNLYPKTMTISTYRNIESIEHFDADYMFVISSTHESLSFYKQHPLFRRLKAVGNDQFHLVPPAKWDSRGIMGAHHVLDDLERYLLDDKADVNASG